MEKKRGEYFSIPNLMGYFRILLAGVYLAVCFEAETEGEYRLAAGLIALSMVTDFLDGKIARRFHMVTDWGKILDPVADKVTLGVVALSFVLRYPLAEKVAALFLVKECFMALAGLWFMRRGWKTEGALFCGKVCTAVLYGASVFLLVFPGVMPFIANLLLAAMLMVMAFTLLCYVELYALAARRLRSGVPPEEISLKALQRERKDKRGKWKKYLPVAALAFLVYLVAGAIIGALDQPEVSEETKAAFCTEDFYGTVATEKSLAGNGSGADAAGEAKLSAETGGENKTDEKNSATADRDMGNKENAARQEGGIRGKEELSAETGGQKGEESGGVDRVRIIDDNGEALDVRLQMIAGAKERVILSTFDFRDDEAGLDIMASLLDAAERGVRVEIFADGFNSWLRMEGNPCFYALSSHPNVEIILYNQVNLLKPWNSMGRMHDKYVIVDDTAYLLGGRNTFGYFLGDYGGHENIDWDVLVYNTASESAGGSGTFHRVESADDTVGDSVHGSADDAAGDSVYGAVDDTASDFAPESADGSMVSGDAGSAYGSSLYQVLAYYEEITSLDCCTLFHDRESVAGKPSVRRARALLERRGARLREESPELYAEEYDYEARTDPAAKVTLLANPIDTAPKEPTVFYGLMELAKEAEGDIVIHTPYVMCSDAMYKSLSELGARATLMLNSAANNGNPFAAIDYLYQKQSLIGTGVTLLEYEGGISYHGKAFTLGNRLSAVGSFNMDMRSAYLDTELMLVIDSPEVNGILREKMGRYEAEAATVATVDTYSQIPDGLAMRDITRLRKMIKLTFGWLLERLRFLL